MNSRVLESRGFCVRIIFYDAGFRSAMIGVLCHTKSATSSWLTMQL